MIRRLAFRVTLFLILVSSLQAQSLVLAKQYYDHGLMINALVEFIQVYSAKESSVQDKSEALYYMGQISFDTQKLSTALNDWTRLISEFPTSTRAKEMSGLLLQLKDVFAKASDQSVNSAVAQSYLNNGDFWSKSDRRFTIDSSWIPDLEMANDWYDKVISEFPSTSAAEVAYVHKLFNLFGWVDQRGVKSGLLVSFQDYMPQVLKTFSEFEAAFPSSSSLQAFRYQIAQAYWGKRDWSNTRLWLTRIVEVGGKSESFYTSVAKARLKNLEY